MQDLIFRSVPRTIIFDLDGTLVDSAPDLQSAVNQLLATHSADPLGIEKVTQFIGNGVPKLVERALNARSLHLSETALAEAVEVFQTYYEADPIGQSCLYPGVMSALRGLASAGTKMGICTNKPVAATQLVLDGLGLSGFFSATIGGDSLSVRKPDPAPLYQVCEMLGSDVIDILYVGDSEADEETAISAGAAFALYSRGYRKKPVNEFSAVFSFGDYADLSKQIGIVAASTPSVGH